MLLGINLEPEPPQPTARTKFIFLLRLVRSRPPRELHRWDHLHKWGGAGYLARSSTTNLVVASKEVGGCRRPGSIHAGVWPKNYGFFFLG